MASVEELLLAAKAKRSPFISLLEGAAQGFSGSQDRALENAKTLMALDTARQEMQYKQEERARIAAYRKQTEDDLKNRFNAVGGKPNATLPKQKLEETITYDTEGNPSRSYKTKETETKTLEAILADKVSKGEMSIEQAYAAKQSGEPSASVKAPAGYRYKSDGTLEPIPGGPVDVKNDAAQSAKQATFKLYETARDGLLSGLEGSMTGPFAGRLPAYTAAQQTAEGGVSAMAPVLKQLFRIAGEGTFTDRDQELLLKMIPTRTDEPEARKNKIENIDRIVKAKLGVGGDGVVGSTGAAPVNSPSVPAISQGADDVALEGAAGERLRELRRKKAAGTIK